MSEALSADTGAAPVEGAPPADGAAAPASQDQGGQQQQSSEAGQGDAPNGDGQGAGNETPADAGAPAEGEQPNGEQGGEPQGAPEQYAAFALPDGYVLEGEMLTSTTEFAKAHNMTQEQAQALVDFGVKQADAIAARFVDQVQQTPVPMSAHWAKQWHEQTSADATLGGKNLQGTMAMANRVFQTFGTPELAEFLNTTGFAHHPELIRFMHAVGKAVSEDTLVTPQGGSQRGDPPGRNTAKKLYPNMN